MSQIVYSGQSNRDLVRLAESMQEIEPRMRKRVIETILNGIEILERFPCISKISQDGRYKNMRELFIPFGNSGYLALYEYIEQTDIVLIASIRHAREAGYKIDMD
jgi:addiction module RelE/StbE family toxin